jgi:TRAP-type C4-dicarboxylate transport system permease large subunit
MLIAIVGGFIIAKVALKLSIELSMLVAAIAGGVAHTGTLPVRHLVEGTFTYFDVCLIFITATFFMSILKENGGVAFMVRSIVTRFNKRNKICLLLLTLVLLIPGALTGAGAATVLTVGALVGPVLLSMGVSENRVVAIVFLCAAMSAAAPPVNLWAMMAAAGSNMPYVGFFLPLLVLSVSGALFSMFFLAGRAKAPDLGEVLKKLPIPPEKMNWLRVGIPFLAFFGLVIAGRLWPYRMPVLGMPMMFVIAAIVAIMLSPKKLKILEIASNTIRSLIPLVGIMVVVGVLIQVMALNGSRGLVSLGVVVLPVWVLFATLFLILPLSEGMLQYAVAPLLGVPLVFLFNMKGFDAVIALSAMAVMWPVGDALPPTAVVGRAAVIELGFKGHYYGDFVKTCLIPMGFILLVATLFLIFSNSLSFLSIM